MEYPFVFVSSLIRSGSTLMLELLTQPPYSFIFHEPALCRNKFLVKDKNLKTILEYGVDINSILKQPTLASFKKDVMPLLNKHIKQIGVKEVWGAKWKNYLKVFPNTKIILLGRDPRDIYISVYYWRNRNKKVATPLTQHRKKLLLTEMRRQPKIFKSGVALKVKYEDLCSQQDKTMSKVKKFINSPMPEIGEVGGLLSTLPKRKREYQQHGNRVTTSSVSKWKKETNAELVKMATDFFNSVPEYCKFWGYRR